MKRKAQWLAGGTIGGYIVCFGGILAGDETDRCGVRRLYSIEVGVSVYEEDWRVSCGSETCVYAFNWWSWLFMLAEEYGQVPGSLEPPTVTVIQEASTKDTKSYRKRVQV